VQFPFVNLAKKLTARFRQELALWSYSGCIVYSDFVKQWLRTRWHRDATVLAPQIQLGAFDPRSKQSLILSVGRFFASGHSKRQDILIAAYKLLPKTLRDSWRLVLAGGFLGDENALAYLKQLQRDAAGHNITFELNVPQPRILELYTHASLFWHATGFGRQACEPEKAEHFGMTTVEAMSFGAVPMVYPDGGQLEIVSAKVGVFWRTPGELATLTERLIHSPERLASLARAAAEESKVYGPANFYEVCAKILR
jgi:glycosyltransferase involved in cell wall biosynthesis